MIVIHFYNENLIENLVDLIKPSGFLIYESIGGNGENWRELDVSGKVKTLLEKQFIINYYKERLVGPEKNMLRSKWLPKKFNRALAVID